MISPLPDLRVEKLAGDETVIVNLASVSEEIGLVLNQDSKVVGVVLAVEKSQPVGRVREGAPTDRIVALADDTKLYITDNDQPVTLREQMTEMLSEVELGKGIETAMRGASTFGGIFDEYVLNYLIATYPVALGLSAPPPTGERGAAL